MLQTILSCPSARGESNPLKLKFMAPNVANYFSPAHQQGGSLTYLTQVNYSKSCKLFFSYPSSRGGVVPTKSQVHDSRCCKRLFSWSLVGGVKPTQTKVHDSKCCKLLFSYPSARGESNEFKLKCITSDVRNDFSPAH